MPLMEPTGWIAVLSDTFAALITLELTLRDISS
jgi:hypothetical protein